MLDALARGGGGAVYGGGDGTVLEMWQAMGVREKVALADAVDLYIRDAEGAPARPREWTTLQLVGAPKEPGVTTLTKFRWLALTCCLLQLVLRVCVILLRQGLATRPRHVFSLGFARRRSPRSATGFLRQAFYTAATWGRQQSAGVRPEP